MTSALRTSCRASLMAVLVALILLVASSPAAGFGEPAPTDGVWPLDPRPEVVKGFDPPAVTWGAGHRGVDLRGYVGQPVRAALGGTISYAGILAGRGVVVVDHGGRRTTYEPVDVEVSVGDVVARGGRLGTLAPTPGHCAPLYCLHWGLIHTTFTGDEYVDPLTLVGGGPVRLVPWDGLPSTRGFGPSGPAPSSALAAAPLPVESGARVGLTVGLA